jgi:DNA-binding transcriptional ArsR family regulator
VTDQSHIVDSVDESADIFRALADPTRRAILDALFASDGQSVGALCALSPEMTRFGVMKHLRVLEEASLVTTVRRGRTKLHYLNPVPIAQIAHRWVSKYAAPFASALVDLESQVAAAPSA